VALRALDAGAHEDLGDVLRKLEHVRLHLEKIGGGTVEGAAFGTEQFDDEFVERHVAGDALTEPLVVVQGGLVGDGVLTVGDCADLHELRPFHDPHLGELLAA